ncbi:MAG: DUF485 domain-containing protein [Nocardioidaceae bacterium]
MTEAKPPQQRERVTRPVGVTSTPRQIEPVREIDEQTKVGEIYIRSLMRSQLRLAVVVLVALALGLGGLPILFSYVPSVTNSHLFGVPITWVVLGFCTYPVLLLLAWFYVRQAERNERHFTDVVDRR